MPVPPFARSCLAGLTAAACTLALAAAPADASPAGWQTSPVGTVVSATRLASALWIPGAASGERLTYVSTDTVGHKALTTGEVFLPKGKAPAGGWKVLSWAHGTSGLADSCAPSVMGPAEPQRDFPYLAKWIAAGYAVVASDYAGLGTPGLPAYLDGRSEAHNVVDMVTAGRAYAKAHLSASTQLSNRWAVIGQSQGGGAAIYTARYATAFGGRALRYVGAVGTGVPAYIEDYASLLGPEIAIPDPTGDLAAYLLYIVAALEVARPQLDIDSALTAEGRKWVGIADSTCIFPLAAEIKSELIGSWFSKPLALLPNWTTTIDAYMKMPESGFDKPFFMGHGLLDTDVPYAATALYVATLQANHQPVTFKTYPTDHSGALVQSQADTIPFVAALFAH